MLKLLIIAFILTNIVAVTQTYEYPEWMADAVDQLDSDHDEGHKVETRSTENEWLDGDRLNEDEEDDLLEELAHYRSRRDGDRYNRGWGGSNTYRYNSPRRLRRGFYIWYRRRYGTRRWTAPVDTPSPPPASQFPAPRSPQNIGTTQPYACQLEGDVTATKECPLTFQCSDSLNIKLGDKDAVIKFCKQSDDSIQRLTCEAKDVQTGEVKYSKDCRSMGECGTASIDAVSTTGRVIRYKFCQHLPKQFVRDPYTNHLRHQSCYFSSGGFGLGSRRCEANEGDCTVQMTYTMSQRTWDLKFCSKTTDNIDYLQLLGPRSQVTSEETHSEIPLPIPARAVVLGTTDPYACKAEGGEVQQTKDCPRGFDCNGKTMTVTHNSKQITITFCNQNREAFMALTCEARNLHTNQVYRHACSSGVCGTATINAISSMGDPIDYKLCDHLPKALNTNEYKNHFSRLVCYYSSGGFRLGGRDCKPEEGTCSAEMSYDMTDRTWDVKVCTKDANNVDYIKAFGPHAGGNGESAAPDTTMTTVPLPADDTVGTSDPYACKAVGDGVHQTTYCPRGYQCNGKTMTVTHNGKHVTITFCSQTDDAFTFQTCEATNVQTNQKYTKACSAGTCGTANLTAEDTNGHTIKYKFCHHLPKPLDTEKFKNHIYYLSCRQSSGGFLLGSRSCKPEEGTCSAQMQYHMANRVWDATMCAVDADNVDYLKTFGPPK